MSLDRDGQPPAGYHRYNNLIKGLEHLLGICRGLVADNVLNEAEIVFLTAWLADNRDVLDSWPGHVLSGRFRTVLADSVVTPGEAEDLKQTIEQVIGGDLENGIVSGGATTLPIDTDAAVTIPGATFCFTGKFLYGPRAACERAVQEHGAKTAARVTLSLDYLVIGALASRDWKYSSYGGKIQAAIKARESGHPVAVVGEDQWAESLAAQKT